jgi:FkbM family methyltransferase
MVEAVAETGGTTTTLQERWYADNIPLRDQVIVDVGANEGTLSEFFWRAGSGTNRVHSIEPLPHNVALISARIAALGADSSWSVEACAVSGTPGELELAVFRTPEGRWNSTVLDATSAEVPGKLRVPARVLSSTRPDATVVKVDIEGHEYPVLDEALGVLDRVHTWALELHMVPGRPLQDVLAALSHHGFATVAAGRRASDPRGPWVNAKITPTLSWEAIPVAQMRPDGSVFKMLHVLARR